MMDQFIWQYKVMALNDLMAKANAPASIPTEVVLQRGLVSMSKENWGYTGAITVEGKTCVIFSKMIPKT